MYAFCAYLLIGFVLSILWRHEFNNEKENYQLSFSRRLLRLTMFPFRFQLWKCRKQPAALEPEFDNKVLICYKWPYLLTMSFLWPIYAIPVLVGLCRASWLLVWEGTPTAYQGLKKLLLRMYIWSQRFFIVRIKAHFSEDARLSAEIFELEEFKNTTLHNQKIELIKAQDELVERLKKVKIHLEKWEDILHLREVEESVAQAIIDSLRSSARSINARATSIKQTFQDLCNNETQLSSKLGVLKQLQETKRLNLELDTDDTAMIEMQIKIALDSSHAIAQAYQKGSRAETLALASLGVEAEVLSDHILSNQGRTDAIRNNIQKI